METSTVKTNGTEKSRKPNSSEYLQIDPSSTFINNTARNGGFEELPENFLDTISPHPSTPHNTSGNNGSARSPSPAPPPNLAPLAPMSIPKSIPSSSSSYSGILSSSNSHASQYPHLEKTAFSNSAAGLLSPLNIDRRHRNSLEFGTPTGFIKEEVDLDGSHMLLTTITEHQEMERIAQAETPPAVSNVELASTMIASLIGGDPQNEESPSPNSFNDPSNLLQQQLIKDETDEDQNCLDFHSSSKVFQKRTMSSPHPHLTPEEHELDFHAKHVYNRGQTLLQASSSQAAGPSIQIQRRIYSTQDSNDPLNAEIDDDIYIDTKDLCKRIAFELKQHSIPQAIFAERILCRSQGTLSDLLRNPKPWNKLKSGRETFRRMYNWARQPLGARLAILDMKSEGDDLTRVSGMSPPTPAQNVRQQRKSTSDPDAPASKRPRLVFTDIQKRTLQAIFKETQRPSREMQQTIAEHLRLDLSTVANFFMNARRRSRIGPSGDDQMNYQHSDVGFESDVYKDDGSGLDMGIDGNSYDNHMINIKNDQSLSMSHSVFSEDSPVHEEPDEVKKEASTIKEETQDDQDYQAIDD